MRLNREKVVAALSLLIFVGGLYQVVVSVISSGPSIEVPDVPLKRSNRTVAKPDYSRFEDRTSSRNPFGFSEGWTSLEVLPLPPPPVPAMSRIVPLLRTGEGPGDSGFIYLETDPRDSTPRSKTSPPAEGGN